MANILPKIRISKTQIDQFRNQSFFVAYSLSLMTGFLFKGLKFHNAFASCFGYGSFEELEHSAQKFKAGSEEKLVIVTLESIPILSKLLAEKIKHITVEDAAIALGQLVISVERTGIERIRKVKVLPKKIIVPAPSVSEYATVITHNGKALLQFTNLGQQLYDEAISLIPKAGKSPDFEIITQKLDLIIGQHPNNPWPMAIKVCWQFGHKFQGSWIDGLPYDPKKGFALDNPHRSDYAKFSEQNAVSLFSTAKDAISLFSTLFLGFIKDQEKPNLLSIPMANHTVTVKNCEAYYWPAILFYGGCISMNCGRYAYSRKWFIQHQKITESSDFGSNTKLATLALIDNGGQVKRYYKDNKIDLWGQLLLAAQCFDKGELILAFDYFSEAMIESWGVIEAFGDRLEGSKSLHISDARKSPAFAHEFMFVTRDFWNNNAKAYAFFKNICDNKELRSALLAYHKAESSLLDKSISAAVRTKREIQTKTCRETYDNLVIKILSSNSDF